MTYEVTIKADHPTGVFHRGGFEFSKVPVVFKDKPPKDILEEPWLVVVAIDESGSPIVLADRQKKKKR